MSFVHNISTRDPDNWFLGVIFTLLGMPVFFIFGIIGIIYSGISFGSLLPLLVGFGFSAVGLYLIYLLIVPEEFTRIVSDEMILCKINGVITHQIKKEDIKMIHIKYGENDSVNIEMKHNETLKLPYDYLMSLDSFSQELMMCGYQVDEN